ncbi:dihydroorotase [Betaproteobacteria bacterium LSUCC0115]|nr:dihydroorotase [Burkholderiales bacterium LSUCC0115]
MNPAQSKAHPQALPHQPAAFPRIAIQGGRLLGDGQSAPTPTDLFIAQGSLQAMLPAGQTPDGFTADLVIDAKGCLVAPGLVDLSARLREPGFEYKATLESEMRAAVAGGVTRLVCPPDTDPPLDEPGLVEMLKHRARSLGQAHVHPLGALTVGLAGERLTEMAELTEAGCVGFSQATHPLVDTQVLFRAMQYAKTFDYTVWAYARDPFLGASGVAHSGAVAGRLGLPGVPTANETLRLMTLFELVRMTGVALHVCRLSSAAGVELIRQAKREGLPITADVAVHHLHMIDVDIGDYDSNLRVDPPFRGDRDRSALRAGLIDGTIDAICSDHSPVDDDAKQLPFGEAEPGVIGLELLLPLTLKWASEDKQSIEKAISLLTQGPAKILRRDCATLSVGGQADLCVFSPDEPWLVTNDTLYSQGRNTPYIGREILGRVRATIIDGRSVFTRSPTV